MEYKDKRIKELKKDYNTLNLSIKKGDLFIKSCKDELLEKATKRLEFLLDEANKKIILLEKLDVKISPQEVQEGFIIN